MTLQIEIVAIFAHVTCAKIRWHGESYKLFETFDGRV